MKIDKLFVIRQTTNGRNPTVSYWGGKNVYDFDRIKNAEINDEEVMKVFRNTIQRGNEADGTVGFKWEVVQLYDAIIAL